MNRNLFALILCVGLAAISVAFAQTAAPVVAPAAAAVSATGFQAFLAKLMALTPAAKGTIIVALGGLLDFAMGVFKTEQPRRIGYLVRDALNGLASLFEKWGQLIDAIFPQKLKDDSTIQGK